MQIIPYSLIDILRVLVYGAMLIYLMCEMTASKPDLSTDSTWMISCITLGRIICFLASLSIPISVAYILIKENLLDLANVAITVLVTIAVELEIIVYGYRLIAPWIAAFSTRAFE